MKKRVILIPILVIAVLLITWFFYPLRSYIVMSVYSGQHSAESVMKENGFRVDMPSGGGWYPFVMTYNADGFREWSGTDADMSIMYNFGAFDTYTRTSSIYDAASDKYSSFYGAYVLSRDEGVYGFNKDGDINVEEILASVRYDYCKLVLSAFGCAIPEFSVNEVDVKKDVEYAGSEGWACIDAQITTNGVAHNYTGYMTPYLQYGRPFGNVEEDFEVINLFGRIYMKYFEDFGCTVMIYVIAPNEKTVEQCDINILKKTRLSLVE